MEEELEKRLRRLFASETLTRFNWGTIKKVDGNAVAISVRYTESQKLKSNIKPTCFITEKFER